MYIIKEHKAPVSNVARRTRGPKGASDTSGRQKAEGFQIKKRPFSGPILN